MELSSYIICTGPDGPHLDSGRGVELVTRLIATVGNYDYIVDIRCPPAATFREASLVRLGPSVAVQLALAKHVCRKIEVIVGMC